MADVVMVCVREDIERAEALAEMFDDFGFSVSDVADDEALAWCGAGAVVWTDAAKASSELAAVVARVMASGKGVVLNFTHEPAPDGAAVCFDMTDWNGDPDDVSLDRMFFALDRMMIAARAARPAGAVAPKPRVSERAVPVMRAAPAPALRLMALSLVIIGAVMATGIAIGGHRAPPRAAIVSVPAETIAARVTLGDAAPLGVAYDLAASPVEDAPVGRRGFEPPSADGSRSY